MLASRALMLLDTADRGRAPEMLSRAAALFEEEQDGIGVARSFLYQGLAQSKLGNLQEAADLLDAAVAACARHDDRNSAALARLHGADVHIFAGDPVAASYQASIAREALADEGDLLNAARADVTLGAACAEQGRLDAADVHLSSALTVLRRLGAGYEVARAVAVGANLAVRRGAMEQAREMAAHGGDLFSALGVPPDRVPYGPPSAPETPESTLT